MSEPWKTWPACVVFAYVLLVGVPLRGQDPDAEQTRWIAELIGQLGKEDGDAEQARRIAELIGQLGEKDRRVRDTACGWLINVGLPAVPALIAELSNMDSPVRLCAALIVRRMGPKAAPAVPALITALSDEDVDVRIYVAMALGGIGPEAAPAVSALIVVLSDENAEVRGNAAEALGRIGPKAAPAIPALIEMHEQDNGSDTATWALRRIRTALEKRGSVLWWVVPRAYWRELIGLMLLLAFWFVVAARFPRHQPKGKLEQAGLFALVSTPPTVFACWAVHHAVTREWAEGFLPDLPITLLPFPAAAALSTAFLCVLASVWASAQRPPGALRTPGFTRSESCR